MATKKTNATRDYRTTLRDIAEYTNVSVMTVSNVVNKKYQFVSKSTRKSVEDAIKKLKYVPSATSRKLRSQQEFSIGMIIMNDSPMFLVDPFISQLIAGLSNHLSENDYSLTVQGVHSDTFTSASIFNVAGTDALCAILCGDDTERKKNVDFLLSRHQPVILFQDSLDIKASNIALINQDDEKGGTLIASHVLARGCERLLFVQPIVRWPAIERRLAGIKKVMPKSKSTSLDILKCEESTFEKTQEALSVYLEKHGIPDAILGGTDAIGIAAMRYCQDQGHVVPDDVLVTGFNGFAACKYSNPSLTTIISPAYEMGQDAGKIILHRLKSGRFTSKNTLLPVALKVGGSA